MVKLVCVAPPVVLNALFVPVEVDDGVTSTASARVAALPNWSCIVTVMAAESTPAVLEVVAEVTASFDAAAALTVKDKALGLARVGDVALLVVVILNAPASSS